MAEIQGSWLRRVWLVTRTLVHSQGLSLPSTSMIQVSYHTFHQVMSPGSQGIFIEEAPVVIYCTPKIVKLTRHLQVCRLQKAERQNRT